MPVSPNWLISTYLVLTVAELFLSPMGISSVSEGRSPKYKGLAQGGWLATAIGNYPVAVIGYLRKLIDPWMLWAPRRMLPRIGRFLFTMMKRLENHFRSLNPEIEYKP